MTTEGPAEGPESEDPGVVSTASAELMANSVGDYARIWVKRIRSGESGALPVIIGLVVIVLIFQVKSSLFLSAGNLVNLMTQAAFIITLGMAEVFVLLLGEIDLAAGYTAACGAVIALWMIAAGNPWWLAVIVALLACAAYGAVQGLVITRLGLPSFVVTLAGYLGLSGVLLFLIDSSGKHGLGGVIDLQSNVINDIEAGSLTPAISWIVMVAIVALTGLMMYLRDRRRRVAGLVAPPQSITLLKVAVMAVAGIVVVLVGNTNRSHTALVVRGLPWVVLVVLGILVIYTVLLGRTRFGRYIYAIGGNAEAARRAGIRVDRIRTSVFVICSALAALSGLVADSQSGSSAQSGTGNVLLLAVGAAVIGGTSLFGGRGRVVDAIVGGLVVEVISYGMSNLIQGSNSSGWEEIITGLVLLLAAGLDAVSRRGSGNSSGGFAKLLSTVLRREPKN